MKTKSSKEKTKTVIYTLRLPEHLHLQLTEAAKDLNISICSFLRLKLTEMLKK